MGRGTHGHRQLQIWQRSVEMAVKVVKFAELLREQRCFGLADQMVRSSVSVPSNIAEGSARGSTADYRRFLRISLASLAELDTQAEIAHRTGYMPESLYGHLQDEILQVSKMVSALWSRLGQKSQSLMPDP